MSFDGGAGTDLVWLRDGRTRDVLRRDAGVGIASDTAASGQLSYASVESVELDADDYIGDLFRVTPSPTTTFTVSGGGPFTAPGDRLEIVPAGARGVRLIPGDAGGGRFEFDNRKTVFFSASSR